MKMVYAGGNIYKMRRERGILMKHCRSFHRFPVVEHFNSIGSYTAELSLLIFLFFYEQRIRLEANKNDGINQIGDRRATKCKACKCFCEALFLPLVSSMLSSCS